MNIAEVEVAWTRPFTVADQMVIDALDERTREAVERYVRDASAMQTAMSDEDMADSIAEAVIDGIDIRHEVESAVRYALKNHRS